ncbi:MAG: copper-binding protein [Rubrivivax sp.]|nr:copper-binding protein [Rubrivivax sp.]
MKRRNVMLTAAAGVVAVALGGAALVFAQGAGNASGEVMKVDKAAGRIEIRHGEIKALDMPPMRMVFRVREPRLLEGLAIGDKVRFTAEKVEGQFTVTAISKAP